MQDVTPASDSMSHTRSVWWWTRPRTAWRLLNAAAGEVDSRGIRIGCTLLLVAYAIIAVLRHDPAHAELLWARISVCVYAALGVALSGRFTRRDERAYAVGLGFLVPLAAVYVDGVLGHHLSELAISGIATFVPLVFLRTGWDFVIVDVGLIAGNAILLRHLPPPALPMSTIGVVVGGAMGVGTAAGVMMCIYRARLQESLTRLQRALNAKSEFLNTMSHELRSPLHVIIGYADMYREAADDPPSPDVADRIRASALELLQLVENTMNVARLDTGRVMLRIEEFRLEDVVRELAEGLRALPEAQSQVPVAWEVAPGLPAVRLDRLKLKETVQNLVSNALKFSREGHVRVTFEREADRLRIAVRDTGVGIPLECQARIFEVFERVETHDTHRPGVGLGLYIVKTLVQLMQGTIEVESRLGAGSCFTVRLPLALAEGGAQGVPAPAGPRSATPAAARRAAAAVANG